MCVCVSGTVGTISHNKIKAGLNNDVIDFHRFSGRSVKSDLNEAEAPITLRLSAFPPLQQRNCDSYRISWCNRVDAFTFPSISFFFRVPQL